MKNIEEFNIAVAEIFAACYEAFPKPVPIFKTDIGNAIKISMGVEHDPKYVNLNDHEFKVVEYTLSWLIQAGYIWAENPNAPPTSMNIRLSPLGLEVLNSIPESLKTGERIGESLSRGIRSLGKEMLITTVNAALSIGLSNASA
jgi:hypothetical protein